MYSLLCNFGNIFVEGKKGQRKQPGEGRVLNAWLSVTQVNLNDTMSLEGKGV